MVQVPEGYAVDPTKCDKCFGDGRVVNSRSPRHAPTGVASVYRRRRCKDCGYRWNTYEVRQEDLDRDTAVLQQQVEQLQATLEEWRSMAGKVLRK